MTSHPASSQDASSTADQRRRLRAALQADPQSAKAHYQLAQLEARIWKQDPASGNLSAILGHLDAALEKLPAEHRPRTIEFAAKIRENGGDLDPLLASGRYPRLASLLTPQSTRKEASPPPTPRQAASRSAPIAFKEVEIGEVDPATLKAWLSEGRLTELACAYPTLDSFRTRRLIVDKAAEGAGADALPALLYVLAHEDDASSVNYVTKKILGLDAALLDAGLTYDRADRRFKGAVVHVLAARREASDVEPLSRALDDPEPEIRVEAIQGLKAVVGAEDDWIRRLGQIVRRDADARVRLEAARALRASAASSALHELETAAKESTFDGALNQELAAMSAEFGARVREGRRKDEPAGEKPSIVEKEKAFSGFNGAEIFKLVLTGLMFLAAAAVAKFQFDANNAESIALRGATDAELQEANVTRAEYEELRFMERAERELMNREMLNEEREARGLPPIPYTVPMPEDPYGPVPTPIPTPLPTPPG